MSRYKDHIINWYQRVHDVERYEETIAESVNISEVTAYVVDQLDLKYETDISHVIDVVSEDWTEFWSNYP
tara:strand:+ start:221 stop:430 length:210 start_codon:yes stop_codon:yes gene_type:complete